MANILVFLQIDKGKILKASLSALNAAQQLRNTWKKDKIIGVLLGGSSKACAESSTNIGVDQLLWNEDSSLSNYLATPYAQALNSAYAANGCDVLVMAATSTGKDLSARVAALLDAGQASDIIAVNSDGSLKRPMYAGNVIADVEVLSANKVVTVRPTAFAAASESAVKADCSDLKWTYGAELDAELVSFQTSGGSRPDLAEAAIVVSGGRALGSAENFEKVIFPLADALAAAVGASRAAVDAGYAPNDWQVGQTGKVVAPTLYVAIGISGAIQHLAGMKDSKTIVAINKDPEAPIFEIADYGLVADLFTVVPQITESIKRAKS